MADMSEPGFLKSFFGGKDDVSPAADGGAPSTENPNEAAASGATEDGRDLQLRVIEVLRSIYDPEIPVDIYELGLIYAVNVDRDNNVHVVMTLTTPHCPVAESLPGEVEMKIRNVEGVNDVNVEITWDPPWDQTMMSEAARLELGFL